MFTCDLSMSTCNVIIFLKQHKLHVNIILLNVYIICLTCRGRCIPPYLCEPKINFKNISKNQFIYRVRIKKNTNKTFRNLSFIDKSHLIASKQAHCSFLKMFWSSAQQLNKHQMKTKWEKQIASEPARTSSAITQ